MRILVTGSRYWQSEEAVWRELNVVALDANVRQVPLIVVHGDCPSGADRFARRWCERWSEYLIDSGLDFFEERHPARWSLFGKRAGFRRNADMVALGADLCLAFIRACSKGQFCSADPEPHGSHGGSHTVELARAAGIEVREFREGW